MRNFCTLFDSNYRTKGLVLHQTLMHHMPDAHLYILCLDDPLYGLLSILKPENTTLIRLDDFLDPALRSKKNSRTYTEWVWTMTPSLPLYILRAYPHLKEIAYVDADIAFFHHLQPMYDEIGDAPCMVIPHRFPPGKEKLENGKYNVSLVWWRNTPRMIDLLQTWRGQCLDWCHYWPDTSGRFADQGYLNDWPEEWDAHVLQHHGCNLAPFNMGQYEYRYLDFPAPGREPEICIYTSLTEEQVTGYKLIFFHFHEFQVKNELGAQFFRCNYARPNIIDKYVYPAYETALRHQIERIRPHVQHTR